MNNNTYGVNSKHNLNFEEEIMLSKKSRQEMKQKKFSSREIYYLKKKE